MSRRFVLGLWTIALIYPLTVILIDRDMFTTRSFMLYVAGVGAITTLIAAALLQYCVRPIPVPSNLESNGAKYASKG